MDPRHNQDFDLLFDMSGKGLVEKIIRSGFSDDPTRIDGEFSFHQGFVGPYARDDPVWYGPRGRVRWIYIGLIWFWDKNLVVYPKIVG